MGVPTESTSFGYAFVKMPQNPRISFSVPCPLKIDHGVSPTFSCSFLKCPILPIFRIDGSSEMVLNNSISKYAIRILLFIKF